MTTPDGPREPERPPQHPRRAEVPSPEVAAEEVPPEQVESATAGLETDEATIDVAPAVPAAVEAAREVTSEVALEELGELEDLEDFEAYEDVVDAVAYAPHLEAARGPRRFVITAPAITLTALVTSVFLMFLLIEPSPRWIVLFGTGITTLALDGVLRAGRREAFAEAGLDTTPQLLVPALYVLTMPVFIEHNSLGYWSALAGLAAGAGYGVLVVGALSSVRELDEGRVAGRFLVTAATYVVAFSMFSLVFLFGVGQTPATIAVGLVATLLAAEILREGEIDPGETLLYSLVTGLVIAEVRWLVHYLPVQGYAAALILLLAFYLVTGLLHSHVVRQLSSRVAAEYASVGALGAAFIAGLRLAGLA